MPLQDANLTPSIGGFGLRIRKIGSKAARAIPAFGQWSALVR